jgi:flavin reductase (DIM6/NTAB) family NADH-FMN oxidoreductase RutF
VTPTHTDTRAFRDALGRFATGVTIVTTLAPDGTPDGLTANSFTSVSLDPPLVLFCIARTATSWDAFAGAQAFAVHVLASHQRDLSARFASRVADKFEGIPWERGRGGVPVLAESLATFECAMHATHDAGDHRILIGRVEAFSHQSSEAPLLYYAGAYASLGRQ